MSAIFVYLGIGNELIFQQVWIIYHFWVVWNHSKSWQTMLHFLKQQVFCVILCHWRVMLVCRHLSESPVIWRFQWSLNVFLVILCLASQHWMKQLCRNGSGCFLKRSVRLQSTWSLFEWKRLCGSFCERHINALKHVRDMQFRGTVAQWLSIVQIFANRLRFIYYYYYTWTLLFSNVTSTSTETMVCMKLHCVHWIKLYQNYYDMLKT